MPLERSSYSSYLLHTHKISLSKKTLYTYIENNIFKNIGIDISTLPSLDKRTLLFFSWHQYDTFHMAWEDRMNVIWVRPFSETYPLRFWHYRYTGTYPISLWNVCKRPITRYIENLQSHSTLEILFFIYNLLVQFLTMANKLLELLFLRKTLHLATSPKDRWDISLSLSHFVWQFLKVTGWSR